MFSRERERERLAADGRSAEASQANRVAPVNRTIASLLLRTSVLDNLEQLFCRVSNEAFTLDELAQVAPIQSARLYVNCEYLCTKRDGGGPTGAPGSRRAAMQRQSKQQNSRLVGGQLEGSRLLRLHHKSEIKHGDSRVIN